MKKKTLFMIFRKFWLIIGLVFLQNIAFADNTSDSSNVKIRKFDEEKVAAFKQNKEFEYEKSTFSLADWWKKFFGSTETSQAPINPNETWVKVIGWVIAILLVVGIVFACIKIFSNTSISSFISGKGYKAKLDYDVSEVNIHTIPFDAEITAAENQGNYTAALRFRYLQIIKKLEERELIVWRLNKTNYEYWRELKDTPFHNEFKSITRIFEFSWYGQYEIDVEKYDFYRRNMVDFHTLLEKNTVSLP